MNFLGFCLCGLRISYLLSLILARLATVPPHGACRALESHSGVKTLHDNSMNKMAAVMTQVRRLLHSSRWRVFMILRRFRKIKNKNSPKLEGRKS